MNAHQFIETILVIPSSYELRCELKGALISIEGDLNLLNSETEVLDRAHRLFDSVAIGWI